MGEIVLTLRGDAPLVMHNARLSDPLDPWSQKLAAVTSKRKKTTEDHALVSRIEFEGALYWDEGVGPFIPAECILACLVEGAKLSKLGKEVGRSCVVTDEFAPLMYEGPRDPEALYKQSFYYRKSVGVGQRRVMRTRPKFNDWACSVNVLIDSARLDLAEFKRIVRDAGQYAGLLERRPMFGRFTPVVEEA